MTPASQQKLELRTRFRKIRRGLDAAARESFDQAINTTMLDMVEELGATAVAAFHPFDGEPGVLPALERLAARNVIVALPVLCGGTASRHLEFHHFDPGSATRMNVMGIAEPDVRSRILLPDLDILFMPLVAWDDQGNRLGMGAGYYDRVLGPMGEEERPRRIGVAYHAQRAKALPAEPWDVPLHGVITERGRFTFTP